MLTGRSSVACSMRARWKTPGVHVVAFVPLAGPVPPPMSVVMPARERLVGLLRADEVHVGVDPAGGHDQPLAGDRLGGDADDHARA